MGTSGTMELEPERRHQDKEPTALPGFEVTMRQETQQPLEAGKGRKQVLPEEPSLLTGCRPAEGKENVLAIL